MLLTYLLTCDAEMRNIEKRDLLQRLHEKQTASQQVCLYLCLFVCLCICLFISLSVCLYSSCLPVFPRWCVAVVWDESRWNRCSRENVWNTAKERKKSRFFGFWKNIENVEVITYRSVGLKTTVTTLNQFCCPSRNYQDHMWGLF